MAFATSAASLGSSETQWRWRGLPTQTLSSRASSSARALPPVSPLVAFQAGNLRKRLSRHVGGVVNGRPDKLQSHRLGMLLEDHLDLVAQPRVENRLVGAGAGGARERTRPLDLQLAPPCGRGLAKQRRKPGRLHQRDKDADPVSRKAEELPEIDIGICGRGLNGHAFLLSTESECTVSNYGNSAVKIRTKFSSARIASTPEKRALSFG